MKIIAVALRSFKCYQATTIVPLFMADNHFLGLIGENGVGKSAVLQGLDTFFTGSDWIRNKTGKKVETVDCAVAPVVVCNRTNLEKIFSNEEIASLNELSKSLAKNLTKHTWFKDFSLSDKEILLSCILSSDGKKLLFDGEQRQSDTEGLADKVHDLIRDSINYIYIDADIDIDEALGVNAQVLKLIKGIGMVAEVEQKLKSTTVGDPATTITDHINTMVMQYFDDTVVQNLQEIDPAYNYKNLKPGAPSRLSEKSLAELATQSIFNNRELTKKRKGKDIGLSDMSSGQRRAALLDFLLVVISSLADSQKEQVILGIDEPEISVGASARIQQFEKLLNVSREINGVLFTTHWYGWVREYNNGSGVLIEETEEERTLTPFLTHNSTELGISKPYEMRMAFDFLSSLGAWADIDPTKKFVVCEGKTDQNYITKHFPDWIVIPVRGRDDVIRLHEMFHTFTWKSGEKAALNIAFLIDTDLDTRATLPQQKTPNLKRISRDNLGKIEIVNEYKNLTDKCTIEDLLAPQQFLKVLKSAVSDGQKKEEIDFVGTLSIKYPDQTGMRALGLDDVQKQTFDTLFKRDLKLKVSELYSPSDVEKEYFKNTLTIFGI